MNTTVTTNGNGHQHGHDVEQLPLPALAYKPKTRDWKFLLAVQDALEADGRISHEAIAKRLNLTRQAVTYRLNDAAFAGWVNAQIERAVDDAWPKVMMRATRLALRGSIDHMNFLAKVGGKFRQGDALPVSQQPINVNILVPRP